MSIVPLAYPKKGSAKKTGYWRIFRPQIDYEKCIKCMICWMYCPEVSIIIVNNKPTVDYEYCKGCGICANECPVKAIEMVKEKWLK